MASSHTNLLNHNFAEESEDQMGLNYESDRSRNLVTVVLCTFKIGLLYTLNGSPQTVIYSVVIICFRRINLALWPCVIPPPPPNVFLTSASNCLLNFTFLYFMQTNILIHYLHTRYVSVFIRIILVVSAGNSYRHIVSINVKR